MHFFIAGEGLKLQKILLYKLLCIYGNLNPCPDDCFMYYTTSQFYTVNLQYYSYKHVFSTRMKNSMDLDQMLHLKPADLDLQFLNIYSNWFSKTMVNIVIPIQTERCLLCHLL